MSAAVKSTVAVSFVLVACFQVTPTLQAAQQRMLEGQANAKQAKDPDEKAYWEGVWDCSIHNPMPMTPEGARPGAGTPYRQCLDANAKKASAALASRASAQKTWRERSVTVRLAKCIEQHDATGAFAPFATIDECREKAPVAEDKTASVAHSDFDDAEKKNDPKAWLAFVTRHPDDDRVLEGARRVVKAAGAADPETQLALDSEIAVAYPPVVTEIPAERRILVVGPRGLRIRDIQKMRVAKVADSVILARVRASREPYKSFDADELGALKKADIPDDLVTAMIEVTTKITESREAEADRKAMRSEIESLKKLVAEKKKAGSGQVVQTKDGPLDVAESCAKRLAAMKLCDQLPFPVSNVCSSGAEGEFPCPIK